MAIPFRCPHCEAETDVYDQFAGQSGPCAVCGREITVPDLQAGGAPGSRPPRRQGVGLFNGLLMIVAGVFGCGGVSLLFLLVLAGVVVALPMVQSATAVSSPDSFTTGTNTPASVGVSACQSNLRVIGTAMQRYHDAHGTYPPAYVVGEDGKPAHSWRVLLLPYLGEDALYEKYDQSQPWNSEHNLKLAEQMPQVYACPDDTGNQQQRDTSYMVIVSDLGVFQGAKSASIEDLDSPSTTLLVVEVASTGICWLEPVDLQGDRMEYQINSATDGGLGSRHEEAGASILNANGTVQFLHEYEAMMEGNYSLESRILRKKPQDFPEAPSPGASLR